MTLRTTWLTLVLISGCKADKSPDSDDTDIGGDTDTDTGTDTDVVVTIGTSMGEITLDLFEVEAPITTANFVSYAQAGFYDGADGEGATTLHRVIEGFMIQGGGLTEDMVTKSTLDSIVNESDNGKSNLRGTIAMARTAEPDSATSQFFINTVDNTFLDIDGSYPPGYAVFGQVSSGMEVVDAIELVETTSNSGHTDVPVTPITITSVVVH